MKCVGASLGFGGSAEEVLSFYRTVFGEKFNFPLQRFKAGTPAWPAGDAQVQELAGSHFLMDCEAHGHITFVVRPLDRVEIHLRPDARAEGDRLFGLLAAGGFVHAPLQLMSCGGSFGTLTDQLGMHWTIICASDALL